MIRWGGVIPQQSRVPTFRSPTKTRVPRVPNSAQPNRHDMAWYHCYVITISGYIREVRTFSERKFPAFAGQV